MAKPLKLQQGQVWKRGDAFLRIVRLERLKVDYKTTSSPAIKGGIVHQVTKKEFCRMLKTAVLLPSAPAPEPRPIRPL
ncbi:MAG: hypothetical protein HZA92_08110 [Verrucomicrobia bacterium]|nr:hypothetical protein [Verrucomicrobiota bacterium]